MKLILGICLLIATGYCSPSKQFHETVEEFDEEFNLLVADPEEKETEAKILKEVEDQINENNKLFDEGKQTYTEKLYKDSILTQKDLDEEKLGLVEPEDIQDFEQRALGDLDPPEHLLNDPENAAKLEELYRQMEMDRTTLPSSYSSVDLDLITTPKNQGSCGSCAAFATHGLHETCMIKAGAPKEGLNLAEQYLIDCGYDGKWMKACKGASSFAYSDWFVKNGGVSPHEAQYQYLDVDPIKDCSKAKGLKWNSGAKVADHVYDWDKTGNGIEDNIKALLVQHGAVVVSIAVEKSFYSYSSGIFQGCQGKKTNHAVVVVGYGTENGLDYWLVKNSWGPNWGENGFFKIKRGTNMCGIGKRALVTLCESTGNADPAPPMPTPAPVPANLKCDISGLYGRKDITGNYNFPMTTPSGRRVIAEVSCENSICTPRKPGTSNACMYICGKVKCTRTPRPTTPKPKTPRPTTPRPNKPTKKTPTIKRNWTCDLTSRLGRSDFNGRLRYTFNGKSRIAKCRNSVCTRWVPNGKFLCQYLCGKAAYEC